MAILWDSDLITSGSPFPIGKGNGNPLQCSCLENSRDWRAWWAAVWGRKSRTRLKWLSSSSSPSPDLGASNRVCLLCDNSSTCRFNIVCFLICLYITKQFKKKNWAQREIHSLKCIYLKKKAESNDVRITKKKNFLKRTVNWNNGSKDISRKIKEKTNA